MTKPLVDDEERLPLAWSRQPLVDRTGTAGADRLVGTPGADRLDGRGGNDEILGLAGGDTLFGRAGRDEITGGAGADTIRGGPGADRLGGGTGRDLLFGGRGKDDLGGGVGADTLNGGGGADVFRLGALDGRIDRVVDFDEAEGDQLDLSAALTRFGPGDRIEDFVELRNEAEGTVVAVDPIGSGESFVDVALLVGVEVDDPPPLATPDPLPPIQPSGVAVELVDVLTAPATGTSGGRAQLNQLFHADDGSGRLFLADTRGPIYVMAGGELLPEPFLDVAEALDGDLAGEGQSGLRGFAFHPDYENPGTPGFGRFYTSLEITAASEADNPDTPVFRNPGADLFHDVIIEWTVDPDDPNSIDPDSGRELLRIEQPRPEHNIGDLRFNPDAAPGDADYGLLYATVGDGANTGVPDGLAQGQDRGSLLGTIIRIDPLQDGSESYSVPADNPFVGDAEALPEVWAYGLRHPQFLSFDPVPDGAMVIAEIGQDNIEELNLGVPGANYGWGLREGTFTTDPDDAGRLYELPVYDASFDFVYPVAQYDHDDGVAIVGGFVYRGDQIPELEGQYIFGDIVRGRIFHVAVDELVLGRQAPIQELTLLRDGAPVDLLDLVDAGRADLRFGQDEAGEIYVTTKQDGVVRTFAPADGADATGAGAATVALESLILSAEPLAA